MDETTITRVITGLVVAGIIWCVASISTLIYTTGTQEVQIRSTIENNVILQGHMESHAIRLARVESDLNGLSVSIATIIKNQDRILKRLEEK